MRIGDFLLKSSIRFLWQLLLFARVLSFNRNRFKRNKICLFHIGRCGSTVIADLLGKHSNISWKGQVFARLFFSNDNKNFAKRNYPKSLALKVLDKKLKFTGTGNIGIEVKNTHINCLSYTIEKFIDELIELGFNKFIILERRNYFNAILSYVRAKQSGVWHIRKNHKVDSTEFSIDPSKVYLEYEETELIQGLNQLRQFYSSLRACMKDNSLQVLEIQFEDDIEKDPFVAYRKICSFLDLPPQNPKIRFTRTNPFPLSELISNFEEVENYLKGSEFEWMLHDNIGQKKIQAKRKQ